MKNPPTLVVYSTVPPDHALAYLRYRAPAEQLGWSVILGKEGENTVYPQRVEEADFVLIQRDFPRFFKEYQQVVQLARQKGIPVLYDLDDAIFALPEDHPLRGDYFESLENILFALLDADRLIVSSQALAEIVQHFNTDVIVWQTVIPDALWNIKPPSHPSKEPPLKIGYMGGLTHEADLRLLLPVFATLAAEFGAQLEFHFWGNSPPEELISSAKIKYCQEFQSYPAFAEAFSQAHADIWLAPLQDNLFNRCKSSIKFWEYCAAGGVGVYSRVAPYEAVVNHGVNGFLAGSTDEWLEYIRFLFQNPELRVQMAQQAQQDLLIDGLLSRHISEWEQIFQSALTKPQLPGQDPAFREAMYRFVSQIQLRFEEKEQRIAQRIDEHHQLESQYHVLEHQFQVLTQKYQKLETQHSRLHEYLRELEKRSMQLDEILYSRSWRLLQRLNKLRRLDFRPIVIPPLPTPPESDQEPQGDIPLQDD